MKTARQEVISDRIVELHYERSRDFGQNVKCYAKNSAGSAFQEAKIPGLLKQDFKFFQSLKAARKNFQSV
jgi:hypothetical protein